MAEPDLAPLVLAGKNTLLSGSEILTEAIINVDELQSELPELPLQTRSRLKTQYGIIFYIIMCIPLGQRSMHTKRCTHICMLILTST